MNRITDIKLENGIVTAIFHTSNTQEANILRRALMSEIETYAIEIAIFDENTSSRHDEIIAQKLGQLVIDHNTFIPKKDKYHIDFSGPGWFTSNHILDIPFTYETPIILLREGEKLILDVMVKKDIGKTHVKWRPLSAVSFQKISLNGETVHSFRYKDIGMMKPTDIFQKGLDKMSTIINSDVTQENIFFRHVNPTPQ